MGDDENPFLQLVRMELSHPGLYILKDGEPVRCDDVLEWGRWMETGDRQIAQDRDESGTSDIRVSTVFLGLDHAFMGGTPILFETMIFGGPHDGRTRRYSTLDEALEGHQDMCRLAKG